MMWRLAGGAVLALVVVVSSVMGSDLLMKKSVWDDIAGTHSLNIVQWEFENLFDKWAFRADQIFRPDRLSEIEKSQAVHDYLSLAQEIESFEVIITREKTEYTTSTKDIESMEKRLSSLKKERSQLEPQVEEIIEAQISAILADECLSVTLDLGEKAEIIFPPLDFEFEQRPNLLIVSARDKIETIDTSLLVSDMSLEEKLEIEEQVDQLGFSAFVEKVGGVATYPSMIPGINSLENLLSTVAHEWIHHYLFFRPLGQNYWTNYDMTTINETVADIAGTEIGLKVYQRFYAQHYDEIVPVNYQAGSDFDFGKEMRNIRITVDQYLADGEIGKAETFMEERRQFLSDNGYYIRKLNQAYFAFHGTYADSPTSVNPIGRQLRELKSQSSSLEDFLGTVSGLSSYRELLDILGESNAN